MPDPMQVATTTWDEDLMPSREILPTPFHDHKMIRKTTQNREKRTSLLVPNGTTLQYATWCIVVQVRPLHELIVPYKTRTVLLLVVLVPNPTCACGSCLCMASILANLFSFGSRNSLPVPSST